MHLDNVIEELKKKNITFDCDVPMSTKTWIHRGPVVPLYIVPKNPDELEYTVRLLFNYGLRYKVVGHTSNIYMLPSYNIDAIISTAQMKGYKITDGILTCEAGVNMSRLALNLVEDGYEGFEGFVNLPGTVGAAIVNNASCYGCIASAYMVSANILRYEGNTIIKEYVKSDFFDFSHRNSSIKCGKVHAVILRLSFKLNKTLNKEALKKKAEWNKWHRRTFQEGKTNNLGSVYSTRVPRRFSLKHIRLYKYPLWFFLKLTDRYMMNTIWYSCRRSHLYLYLYGFRDIRQYVSKHNDNCFIWKDNNADKAFIRYMEFMNISCVCGPMEIEICK